MLKISLYCSSELYSNGLSSFQCSPADSFREQAARQRIEVGVPGWQRKRYGVSLSVKERGGRHERQSSRREDEEIRTEEGNNRGAEGGREQECGKINAHVREKKQGVKARG